MAGYFVSQQPLAVTSVPVSQNNLDLYKNTHIYTTTSSALGLNDCVRKVHNTVWTELLEVQGGMGSSQVNPDAR